MHASVSLSDIQIEVPKRSLYNMNVHVLLHWQISMFFKFWQLFFFIKLDCTEIFTNRRKIIPLVGNVKVKVNLQTVYVERYIFVLLVIAVTLFR